MKWWTFLSVVIFATFVSAETHTWWFNTTWVDANPDGVFPRKMIGFNNSWPLPTLRVKKGDRVNLYLTNTFDTANTTLHFHGLFQPGSSQMDGPPLVSQCPIPVGETFLYNFTVGNQAGSYWYHSHTSGQYGDGMRGVFIIEDDDFPYDYYEEVVLTLGEHYHQYSDDMMPAFLSRFNPTGAEPIIDNILFNETRNATWKVEPGKTYLLRIINTGRFVSQYLWLEDHNMTVVEVDGVYTEPKEASMLYITVAQRYAVLITTKNSTDQNYAFMNKVDDSMLDNVPKELQLNGTNYLVYNETLFEESKPKQNIVQDLDFLDDFYLVPLGGRKLYDDADYTITVDVQMDNLGNGVNYAFFNNISYTSPKVPTLHTVLSAGEAATNELIYGSNTNTFVLEENEVIDIVLNNFDTGTHPFHLHGHVFQLIARGPAREDTETPLNFNISDHAEFPQYPMMRDVVYVRPQSYFAIRFKADNPGVWFFHCHIEWHLDQGLAMVLVENPNAIINNSTQQLTENHIDICKKVGVSYQGNAAANTANYLDLSGENVQVKRLPTGFTAKGIIALVFSCVAAILGLATIAFYGMQDIDHVEERVAEDLDVDLDVEDNEDSVDQIIETGSSSSHNTTGKRSH